MSIGIPTKEAKAEIETHAVTAEASFLIKSLLVVLLLKTKN